MSCGRDLTSVPSYGTEISLEASTGEPLKIPKQLPEGQSNQLHESTDQGRSSTSIHPRYHVGNVHVLSQATELHLSPGNGKSQHGKPRQQVRHSSRPQSNPSRYKKPGNGMGTWSEMDRCTSRPGSKVHLRTPWLNR